MSRFQFPSYEIHVTNIACAFCGLILYTKFRTLFWVNHKLTFDSNGLQGRRVVEFYHRRLYWDTELAVFLRVCNTQIKRPNCLQRNVDEYFIYSSQCTAGNIVIISSLFIILLKKIFETSFKNFPPSWFFISRYMSTMPKNEFILTPQLLCMETKLVMKDNPHLTTQYTPVSKSWI